MKKVTMVALLLLVMLSIAQPAVLAMGAYQDQCQQDANNCTKEFTTTQKIVMVVFALIIIGVAIKLIGL